MDSMLGLTGKCREAPIYRHVATSAQKDNVVWRIVQRIAVGMMPVNASFRSASRTIVNNRV
jgi:hypothetical protein